MDLQLQGKLALVSGSTAGIGLAIASALARESATVIVNGRQASRVAEAIAEIRKTYPAAQVREFVGDLSKREIADQATHDFPDVQILVNPVHEMEHRRADPQGL